MWRGFVRVVARGACISMLFTGVSKAQSPFIRGPLRGDVNLDAVVDISDPVALLGSLFLIDGPLACPAAASVNADDSVDISDAVSMLLHLFAGASIDQAPLASCRLLQLTPLSTGEVCDGAETTPYCRALLGSAPPGGLSSAFARRLAYDAVEDVYWLLTDTALMAYSLQGTPEDARDDQVTTFAFASEWYRPFDFTVGPEGGVWWTQRNDPEMSALWYFSTTLAEPQQMAEAHDNDRCPLFGPPCSLGGYERPAIVQGKLVAVFSSEQPQLVILDLATRNANHMGFPSEILRAPKLAGTTTTGAWYVRQSGACWLPGQWIGEHEDVFNDLAFVDVASRTMAGFNVPGMVFFCPLAAVDEDGLWLMDMRTEGTWALVRYSFGADPLSPADDQVARIGWLPRKPRWDIDVDAEGGIWVGHGDALSYVTRTSRDAWMLETFPEVSGLWTAEDPRALPEVAAGTIVLLAGTHGPVIGTLP